MAKIIACRHSSFRYTIGGRTHITLIMLVVQMLKYKDFPSNPSLNIVLHEVDIHEAKYNSRGVVVNSTRTRKIRLRQALDIFQCTRMLQLLDFYNVYVVNDIANLPNFPSLWRILTVQNNNILAR